MPVGARRRSAESTGSSALTGTDAETKKGGR
jgi:hypothetical protein